MPPDGLTKPLITLKKVVLPAPLGPISPHVPSGNVTLMPSIGLTPPKRTSRFSTSITSASPIRPRPPAPRPIRRAQLGHVLRELVHEPGGRREQHLEHPDAEEDREQVRGQAPAVEQRGQVPVEQARHDRAPEAVDAAHQHDREQDDVLAGGEAVVEEAAHVRGQEPAGHAGHERGQRERPELVERHVHAGGQRRRLALADRLPRPAGLAAHVPERQQEHQRRDHHRVAEEGRVGLGDRGAADRAASERGLGVAEEAAAAVREVGGRQPHR